MSLASKSSRTLSATCATLATSSRSVFRHSQILIKKAIHPSSCTLSRPPSSLRTLSTTSKPPTPPRKPLNRSIPFGAAATLLIGLSTYFYTSEEESILAPDRWTDVTIESVERLTSDTSLFRINVPKSVLPEVLNSDPDAQPILSLFVKEPTLQIQRAYTVRRLNGTIKIREMKLIESRFRDVASERIMFQPERIGNSRTSRQTLREWRDFEVPS